MTSAQPVRVRIAPSPTGYLHVGTARTAIYNYLFARRRDGTFVLRIEDTDRDRSQSEFVQVILDGLRWLGIEWDEGPIHQADRFELYGPHIQTLLEKGRAYRCYCTPADLDAERLAARAAKADWQYSRRCRHLSRAESAHREADGQPFSVRLAVPETGETCFRDLVAGTLRRHNSDIEDFVIARSDGRALYNFAVVVDDHLMQISHVIRGNDHITNTYKQVLIYAALGWDSPAFAHVPLILRPDKSKVSKRKGDASVTDYRDRGYLPEALLNYLCLLGWSPGDDREIFTRDELIEAFDVRRVAGANPIFDPAKLEWMNGDYIRRLPTGELARRVEPFVLSANLTTAADLETRRDWFCGVVGLLQERCKTLAEFPVLARYFFVAPDTYDSRGVTKHFRRPGAVERLRELAGAWDALTDFRADLLEETTQGLAEAAGAKTAAYIHPARLALTGTTTGPGLYELAAALDRAPCVARLRRAAEAIEADRIPATLETSKEKKP
jgi:glutamyl-tRNA synthetase